MKNKIDWGDLPQKIKEYYISHSDTGEIDFYGRPTRKIVIDFLKETSFELPKIRYFEGDNKAFQRTSEHR